MSFFVVDTNVPVVANNKSKQADLDCVLSCIEALSEIYKRGIMILDDSGLILQEYINNLSLSGQPGAGDVFMRWVFDNQGNPKYCKQVHINPCENDPKNFVEFPQDDQLKSFDRSDRVFVAVALVGGHATEILNAVDPDWSENFLALTKFGIKIRFLCPQHVSLSK